MKGRLKTVEARAYHVCRAFRRSTGTSLLQGNPIPLSEVVHLVGYASQQSFTTTIRSVTGTPPGRWRSSALELREVYFWASIIQAGA